MTEAVLPKLIVTTPPHLAYRLYSIWYRHIRVYCKHLVSNGFPPFVEPLFFLAGVGLGLGHYVGLIDGTPYLLFLASGMIAPSSMFTAAFECTFGTFIRLEFDKAYDGMVSASITVTDLFVGEMLFVGTKGFFFTLAVMSVFMVFGLVPSYFAILTPLVGFFAGMMFGALSLFVTSFVKTINHFNFFLTGCLTPMFFFSGIVFPITNLPEWIQWVSEVFPLTHSARLIRACCLGQFSSLLFFDILFMVAFTIIFGYLAVSRLGKRLIQ